MIAEPRPTFDELMQRLVDFIDAAERAGYHNLSRATDLHRALVMSLQPAFRKRGRAEEP
jgi:hypothetical protein